MSDETMPEVTPEQREEIAKRVLGKDVLRQYQTLEAVVNDDDVPFGDSNDSGNLTLPGIPEGQSQVRITFTSAPGSYEFGTYQKNADAMNEWAKSDFQGRNTDYLASNGVLMEFEVAPQLPEVKA